MTTTLEKTFSVGKFLVSPFTHSTESGDYAASLSIRSGRGSGTLDRVAAQPQVQAASPLLEVSTYALNASGEWRLTDGRWQLAARSRDADLSAYAGKVPFELRVTKRTVTGRFNGRPVTFDVKDVKKISSKAAASND